MQCPKCHAEFETKTYGAKIAVQCCTGCGGLFASQQVLQEMRKEWMSDVVLDSGDARLGKEHDKIGDINCPQCAVKMNKIADESQYHIWMELCSSCGGVYLDAGELSDLKYTTWVDAIRNILKGRRGA